MRVHGPAHQTAPAHPGLCPRPERGAGPLVPLGDQVFDVGVQLVVRIDVNVLKQSGQGQLGLNGGGA